jgi:hexosaminidase
MTGRGISTVVELWQYFEIEAIAKVEKQGKRAIIWHDSFEAGAMLPPSTILDIWMLRNMEESTYRATNAGHDVVLSACWYLDHLDPDWWSFYQCNPRNFVIAGSLKLSDEQISRILGGHSSMWGELVDATNFFERVWPRASATAEVLWAGGIGTDDTTIQDAVRRRLERFRCWIIQQFDIAASPISIQHCELPSRFHSSEMS